jgi:hypothetical protein
MTATRDIITLHGNVIVRFRAMTLRKRGRESGVEPSVQGVLFL